MCFYLINTLLNNCKKGAVVEEGVKEKATNIKELHFCRQTSNVWKWHNYKSQKS